MAIMPRYTSSDIAVATPQGQFRDVSAPMDQLSSQMDRMTGFFIQEAKQQAIVQAEEYAADKAPTIQQIEEARRLNQPIAPIADKTTIFGRAANEAQSRILAKNVAAAADMQMAQLQQDVSSGKVRVNDIANQTNALIKGYSSALAEVDPMVARSLEADLALSGNRLFVSATKAAAADAAARQNQMITDSIKAALPNQVTQIFAAGDVLSVGPTGETVKVDVQSQIKAAIERAKDKADSLPTAAKRKEAYKEIQTALKEGAERYGQEVVIKGSLDDLKALESQIRGGKFDAAMVDPKDRITLLSTVNTRINQLEEAPKKALAANKLVINQQLKDFNSSMNVGNANPAMLPSADQIKETWPDDPVTQALKLRERDAALSSYSLASEMQYKSEKERNAIVEAARLAATDEDSVKRYETVLKVNENIQKQVKADPAKFVQKFDEVKTAWTELQNSTEQTRATNAAKYAAVAKQRQIEAGVLPGDVKYLPKDLVEEYKDSFDQQLKNHKNWAQIFMGESEKWGSLWPDVVKEMNFGPEVLVISNMASNPETMRAAEALAIALQPENKKALEDIHSKEKGKIEEAVSTHMTDFNRSLNSPAIKDADTVRQSVQKATSLLTMVYMSRGQDMNTAAEKAYNDVVGGAYEFGEGFRVPRSAGVSAATIQSNADLIRQNIDTYRDMIQAPVALTAKSQNIDQKQIMDQYLDNLKTYGSWINTQDDRNGLRFVDSNGMPVRLKSGKILELSWDKLNNPLPKLRAVISGGQAGIATKQGKQTILPAFDLGIE
jgi:hypothetical protein